jgi:hypothetical protein
VAAAEGGSGMENGTAGTNVSTLVGRLYPSPK